MVKTNENPKMLKNVVRWFEAKLRFDSFPQTSTGFGFSPIRSTKEEYIQAQRRDRTKALKDTMSIVHS
jgi:hypothetical protein